MYLLAATLAAVILEAVCTFWGMHVLMQAWKAGMGGYSGGLPLRIVLVGYVKIFVFIMIGYLMVMGLDFWRMKKIPTDGGLKDVE